MSYAPIALFCYNRADHLQQTFEALLCCPEAKNSELFIFSDGAKNEGSRAKVDEVRHYLRSIADSDAFQAIHIQENPVNMGLAASIIAGVTKIIERYGRIIVVEDDCIASPYFLAYMNRCLDSYQSDVQIGSIAGYAPAIKLPADYGEDIYLARRSCSWGWATWADRWQGVDWDMERFSEFYHHPEYIKRLNANGNDRFIRLYRQRKGQGSSWSIRFGAYHAMHDWWVVYPRYSYISNVGCDESGVHSKSRDAKAIAVDLHKSIPRPNLQKPQINKTIQHSMNRFYSGHLVSRTKRMLVTVMIRLRKK